MSHKITNLKDLFIEQGRELYDASRQEQKELPHFQEKVSNQQLREILDRQIRSNKEESSNLQESLNKLSSKPKGEKSECCGAILKQTRNLLDRSTEPDVRDAIIINSLQRLNHNKITGLGSLASYAREIGAENSAVRLHRNLEEEKEIDRALSQLAEREVNRKAGALVP